MPYNSKILFFVLYLFVISNKLVAAPKLNIARTLPLTQIDSLIKQKNISNDMTQLELLILYHDAIAEKHPDSIKIFKNLAILNADLGQPEDALLFTEKYIENSLDFSILNDRAYEVISDTKEYGYLNKRYLFKVTPLVFVYFYAALIGFFFMVLINFTKGANRNAKIFIGSFVGIHSLFILEFVLYMSNIQYEFPHTYRMSSAFSLLYGPLLYFYFKSITQHYKFKKIDLLHFVPTLFLLAFIIPVYSLSSQEKVKMILSIYTPYKSHGTIIFISKIISLVVYAFLIGRLLRFSKQNSDKAKVVNTQKKDKWKRTIYRIHIAYIISYIIYGISAFGAFGNLSSFIYHIQIGAMAIMIIYIAFMAYVRPGIFEHENTLQNHEGLLEKYQKSGLTNALSQELKENLIKLFVEDKIYKENNINLEILSQRLNTTRHNTSQIINEHFNINFFELINKFRIKEAINILKEDVHGSLNIIDIAYEVGYNNKVTFNKAFKKETSLTPSEFIDSQLKKNIYE
ncbi:helix-turn-helix domain-containing protein [Flavivirga algicola]|uniref:AraC family transcriptional regulator n=1 Tax=Flavivirga algicola TaxID=2729136 RepID=A0ABX1RVU0_9FLAO|nr:helix-turn-helix domain-containing protein [Flavivirga algicola]NMH87676.1 AraC family transcriptional regulator [Flavivirga algicola]